jgi:hypothetical protein
LIASKSPWYPEDGDRLNIDGSQCIEPNHRWGAMNVTEQFRAWVIGVSIEKVLRLIFVHSRGEESID